MVVLPFNIGFLRCIFWCLLLKNVSTSFEQENFSLAGKATFSSIYYSEPPDILRLEPK